MTVASSPVSRVHLVYPHAERISAPDSIGRKLAQRLSSRYEVVLHDWHWRYRIDPKPGDILVGHPHPDPGTVFRMSAVRAGWNRVLMLCPYNEDLDQWAYLELVIGRCDQYLAICGPYWWDRLDRSVFSHWRPKMVRLDMAIDAGDFPLVKSSFNPAGRRRFVYIGNSLPMKNVQYLGSLAERLPGTEFARIGPARTRIAGVVDHGRRDFGDPNDLALIRDFDFLIMPSRIDANPTTILEAMAWGLIPVCTPQCGYEDVPGIINIPLDAPDHAASVIRELQELPDSRLLDLQEANRRRVVREFTWDRFAATVIGAIESAESPPISTPDRERRLQFAWAIATSRYHSPPRYVLRRVGRHVKRHFVTLVGRLRTFRS